MIEIISVILGGTIGIFGIYFGYRRARSTALETIRITGFNKAATKLREAFLPIRMAINPAQFALKEDLGGFLDSHFNDTRRAVLEFSDVLDAKTKTAFLQVWYEYYCHEDGRNEKNTPFFEQYFLIGKTIEEEHEVKKLVQSRIEKILEFAKQK